MNYKCAAYETWSFSETVTCLVAYTEEAFRILQRHTHRYPAGTKFQAGEEPLFKINTDDLKNIYRKFSYAGLATPHNTSERSRKSPISYTTEGLIGDEGAKTPLSEGSETSEGT